MDFASSNINKYNEIYKLVSTKKYPIKVTFKKMELKEIQSDSLLEVAENKVYKHSRLIKKKYLLKMTVFS